MTGMWPAYAVVEPLGVWPRELTLVRQKSKFDSTHSATLALLRRELTALKAKDIRLQVAIPPEQFRLDGFPRAGASTAHPGVILTFETRHGKLSYPCDTYRDWTDNLRAIALSLEALRKVDRYGVTVGGEQYRGSLAIEAAPSQLSDSAALETLRRHVPGSASRYSVTELIRYAQRATHPDQGGNAEDFQAVTEAAAHLTKNGYTNV